MIPKIIHYCWFGGNPLPPSAIKCINSWRQYLPEYEIIEWNEENFPINEFQFAKEAIESKKYAFVSDVCRLYALKKLGGIYMDTDVEVLKPLEPFLGLTAFSGFESNDFVPTGIMASVKNGDWINELLNYYNHRPFIKENGELDNTTNTSIITELMIKKGFIMNNAFQSSENYVAFYPSEYFCPKSYQTGKIVLTENTHCIHHFSGSWKPWRERWLHSQKGKIRKIIGYKNVSKIGRIVKKFNSVLISLFIRYV